MKIKKLKMFIEIPAKTKDKIQEKLLNYQQNCFEQ